MIEYQDRLNCSGIKPIHYISSLHIYKKGQDKIKVLFIKTP